MISSIKKNFFLLTILTKCLSAASQERCISEHFREKENSVFTCDFQTINENVDEDNKCVHFLGLPNVKVCGEVGLRFKLLSNDVNSSILLSYFAHINREVKYENIEMDGKDGWHHWSKSICADFLNGVNIYFESSAVIQLDRMLMFMNPKEMNHTMKQDSVEINHNACDDSEVKHRSHICDPEVQYFGWKVTAIILIIVTIGSLILVISLSVTMPYNVWDKPKIQIIPSRRMEL